MRATEQGVQIIAKSGGMDLTGATVTLRVQQEGSSSVQSLTMSINTDNVSATRTTQSTDFPTGGRYNLILKAVYPNGNVFYSDPALITVTPVF